ncbi:MAG: hypothetical protein U9R57_10160 [Thermodesulfobacteriota bacterium]|nr:hypothetical protein [Thermodesulfobacteriota bacterium]
MLKSLLILLLIPLSTFCLVFSAQARLNTFTGGMTTGYDYDRTKYENSDDEALPARTSYLKQLSLGPIFILETTSSIDQLTISYNPDYTYDFENSNNDVDHHFSLSGYRSFSKRLLLDLSDTFIYSDDPNDIETDNISDYNSRRRRYWTNDFNINSTYSYDTGSSFGVGYTYRILRNDDTGPGGYEDYDRHIANLSLQHYINSSWNIGATTSYTRGLFDPPDPIVVDRIGDGLESLAPGITEGVDTQDLSNDLSEYRAGVTLNWILSQRKTFLVSYNFSGTDYDAILRFNTIIHDFTFGAQYQHTTRLSFGLGGGPSYVKTETFEGNLNYNAYANLDYDLSRHSHFTASVEKGYDQENFMSDNNTFGSDQGLTEFWQWRMGLSHQLLRDLQADLFISYRDEKQGNFLYGVATGLENENDLQTTDRETFREESIFSTDIYEAGGSLNYSFTQDWSTAFHYTYRKQNSDLPNDNYDEHRIYLTLTVQKELFRW